MMRRGWPLFLILSTPLWARTKFKLERLNFFPDSKAYAILGYQYQVTYIDTPKQTAKTDEILNYSNSVKIEYAHKITRKAFLGLRTSYSHASENALRYGIPLEERFTSSGISEPEYFLMYRLREQNTERGNIDFGLSYLDNWGSREVGSNQSPQYNHGRNMLSLALRHGKHEEDWEFRTGLEFNYYDEGQEKNGFTNKSYDIESLRVYAFNFGAQYEVDEWLYINAMIGIFYRGTEKITDREGDNREIQAGTGSVFSLGLKKPLSDWNLIQLQGHYSRNEYFVKGTNFNLDGRIQDTLVNLNYIQAF